MLAVDLGYVRKSEREKVLELLKEVERMPKALMHSLEKKLSSNP